MQRLVDGIHEFQNHVFREQEWLFKRLETGQEPLALFITCSDSRIDPTLLTQTEPGELFILRNAGNIVPAYGAVQGGEAATIEYAVSALKIKDIIVCGHSKCGAMAGLLQPESLRKMPAVEHWLGHAESTRRIVEENYAHIADAAARLTLCVEENVLVQLENLRTHPSVAAALARGTMKLHGWVYKFETGEVFAFNPAERQFVRLEDAEPIPAPDRHTLPVL